jgi:cytochrome c oxidase subunit 1
MTDTTFNVAPAAAPIEKNYLNEETTLWSWLTTTDHKRIGILYAFSITFFFFI